MHEPLEPQALYSGISFVQRLPICPTRLLGLIAVSYITIEGKEYLHWKGALDIVSIFWFKAELESEEGKYETKRGECQRAYFIVIQNWP